MPRITDTEITGTDISLHLLAAADEAPNNTAYDGAGTNNLIAPVREIGDLEDSWNTATFHNYGERRESFLQTFKGLQEIEITLGFRPSDTAQAALITAFDSRAEVILALVVSNGDSTPDEDQVTFTARITSRVNMFPKDDIMNASFTFTLVGDPVYAAKTT